MLVPLLAAACAAQVKMHPEVVNQRRHKILSLAVAGKTREAWEEYFELVDLSKVDQYPGLVLEIATQVLKHGLHAPHPDERLKAVGALQYTEAEFAYAASTGRLEDQDLTVRAAVVDVLRHLGRPEAIELIRPQLRAPPTEERELFLTDRLRAREGLQMHAMLALAALGEKSLPVAPAVKAMSSPDADVRAVAARALGELGNPEALPSLRYGLEDDIEWRVNVASAEALLKLGRNEIVERFTEGASQSDYPEKVVWAIDMRQYKGFGPSTQWILTEATANRYPQVRARAAVALGEMGVEEAEPRLREMLRQHEAIARISAAYALARLARAKVRMIEEATGSDDPMVRSRAVEFLAQLDGEKYEDIFRKLLDDSDPETRLAAVLAFRFTPPDMAFRHLAWPLGDENDTVRLTAAALIRGSRPVETGK